jgi:hypothetical protein
MAHFTKLPLKHLSPYKCGVSPDQLRPLRPEVAFRRMALYRLALAGDRSSRDSLHRVAGNWIPH